MKRAAVVRSAGVVSLVMALSMGVVACGPVVGNDAGDAGAEASVRDEGPRDESAPDGGSRDEGPRDEGTRDEGAPDAGARVISLAIDPAMLRLGGAGGPRTATVIARGVYSDGTTRPLEDERGIEWTSSNPAAATVDATGMVSAMDAGGETMITARQGSLMTSVPCAVSVARDHTLRSIGIDPPVSTINIGGTQRFTVTGNYSDGTTEDLTARATFSAGASVAFGMGADANVVTAIGGGTTTVIARVGEFEARAEVTVNDDGVRSLLIEPGTSVLGAGTTQTFRLVGVFGDGSSVEITDGITWSSSDTASATVDAMGVVTGIAASTMPVTITATLTPRGRPPISATAQLLVTGSTIRTLTATLEPTGSLGIGVTAQVRVAAIFGDGMARDVTAAPEIMFASSNDRVVTVSSRGLARGVRGGMATITVNYGGLMTTLPVNVSGNGVVELEVTPGSPSALPVGGTQAFTARARLSDGSTRDITNDPGLTFASSNPRAATISNAPGASRGVATGVDLGSTNITATYTPLGGEPVISAPVPLNVIGDFLVAIVVTPRTSVVPNGFTVRYSVTGQFANGTTRDLTQDPTITWSSSNEAVVTIANLGVNKGLATARGVGMATITATYNGGRAGAMPLTSSAAISVNGNTITSLRLTPAEATVITGRTQLFTVLATFIDGTTADVTEDAEWSLAPGYTGGAISNSAGSRGAFTAGSSPAARVEGAVRARVPGVSTEATAAVTVAGSPTGLVVRCTRIDPATGEAREVSTLVAGQRARCGAYFAFADGTSTPANDATIRASGAGSIDATGLLTAGAMPGALSVEAIDGAATARTVVAVEEGGAPALSVLARPGLLAGGPRLRTADGIVTQLVGVATYSYMVGSRPVVDAYEITEQGAWTSSAPAVLAVSNAVGTRGSARATAVAGVSTVRFALGAATAAIEIENTAYQIRSLRTAFVALDGSFMHRAVVSDTTPLFVRGEFCPAGAPSGASECGYWDVTSSVTFAIENPAVAALTTAGWRPAVRAIAAGTTAVRATFGTIAASGVLTVVHHLGG